jgi:predicted MPP superfamily phosphohydrolase
MFGTVLTAGFTLMLVYVLWRARSVPFFKRYFSRNLVLGLGTILWLVFFFGRIFGHQKTGALAGTIELAGMTILGAVFLLTTAVFIVDLCTFFGLVFSRWRPTLFGIALAAGATMACIALIQGLREPAVVSHEVALSSLPVELDRTVVVAISDTHLGAILDSRWMDDRIVQIQALRPDLLVFIGDIFEGHGAMLNPIPALNNLSVPLGKWYVDGNHESHHSNEPGLKVLEEAGFHRLENQWAEPAPGLILSGVNDLTNHRRQNIDGDPLAPGLTNRPEGATILLSHTPWQTERAAQAGVELMLSGHTHGGQIWPFGHLVQKIYPFIAGRYNINGMTLLVSRGTGTWGPRMRLWYRSEIIKVTLRAPQSITVKHQ